MPCLAQLSLDTPILSTNLCLRLTPINVHLHGITYCHWWSIQNFTTNSAKLLYKLYNHVFMCLPRLFETFFLRIRWLLNSKDAKGFLRVVHTYVMVCSFAASFKSSRGTFVSSKASFVSEMWHSDMEVVSLFFFFFFYYAYRIKLFAFRGLFNLLLRVLVQISIHWLIFLTIVQVTPLTFHLAENL